MLAFFIYGNVQKELGAYLVHIETIEYGILTLPEVTFTDVGHLPLSAVP